MLMHLIFALRTQRHATPPPTNAMERLDLEWITDVLPTLVGGADAADAIVDLVLAQTMTDGVPTRQRFFEHLGWELADYLQAMWAFKIITLEEAIDRANVLSDHLMADQEHTEPETPAQTQTSPRTTGI